MIYITGDIHGEVFRVADVVERFQISSEDMIVILGDVGMNYYGNSHGDRHRKKKLNKLGVHVFCIHGNHEMRPGSIDTYHEIQWHGGTVYIEDEYPNLLFGGLVKDSGISTAMRLRIASIQIAITIITSSSKTAFIRWPLRLPDI